MKQSEVNAEMKRMQKAEILVIGDKKYIEFEMALKFTERAVREAVKEIKILDWDDAKNCAELTEVGYQMITAFENGYYSATQEVKKRIKAYLSTLSPENAYPEAIQALTKLVEGERRRAEDALIKEIFIKKGIKLKGSDWLDIVEVINNYRKDCL